MWVKMTSDLLLTRLSSVERARLATAATAAGQSDVLAEIAGQIAADWRAGLRRVTLLDARAGYVPDEFLIHMLAHFRYAAYTRLPGMGELLDDLRIKEWERANHVRDNLARHASVDAPDPAYAESLTTSGKPGPAIEEPPAATVL